MIYERLRNLCEKYKTTPTALCVKITGSKGNLPTWKKGNIRSDYLLTIANEFNVSIDYLLCNTDDPAPISETKKTAAEKFSDDLKQIFIDAGDIKPGEELSDGLKEYMKDLVRSAVAKRLNDA